MNGFYRRFMHLIQAAGTGLSQQIPIVGPVLQSMLAERERRHLLAELKRLFSLLQDGASLRSTGLTAGELEQDLNTIVANENNSLIASVIFQAEAEAGNRLAKLNSTPERRFLYLAGDNYADSAETLRIAAELGFLWRSYHAATTEGGRRNCECRQNPNG